MSLTSDGGGGERLALVLPSRTHYLRGEAHVLREWRRALYRLVPHLQPFAVCAGWLLKANRESGASGGVSRLPGGLRPG